MNKLAIVAAAALAATSFGTAAVFAEDAPGSFDNADANKDGVVSMTEAQGVFPTLTQTFFEQADANHDGNLDEGEFSSLQALVSPTNTEKTSSDASSEASSEASSSAQ